jgi:hypothetical protein
LRKLRQGIDVAKLNKGDVKKKKRLREGDDKMDKGGLRIGGSAGKDVPDDEEYVSSAVPKQQRDRWKI